MNFNSFCRPLFVHWSNEPVISVCSLQDSHQSLLTTLCSETMKTNLIRPLSLCVSSAPRFKSFLILCTLIPVPSTTCHPFHTPSGTGSKPLVKPLTTLYLLGASPVAQMVKKLPAMQETWVQSLGQADSLEKGMTTHSSILTQRIPWTEEPGRLQFLGSQRVRDDWVTNACTFTFHLLALTKPGSPRGPCSPPLLPPGVCG